MGKIPLEDVPNSVLSTVVKSLNGKDVGDKFSVMGPDPSGDGREDVIVNWAIPEDEDCREYEAGRVHWEPDGDITDCQFSSSKAEIRAEAEEREDVFVEPDW